MQQTYEAHRHPDPNFPIIFHLDTLRGRTLSGDSLHWHENVELLFCVEGEGTVVSNAERISMRPGELAVVNSDHLHAILTEEFCQYYCLIVDKALFATLDLPFGELEVQSRVADPEVRERFSRVIREMEERRPYYKTAVISEVIGLAAVLCRRFGAESAVPEGGRRDNRLEMVKSAISYIRRHCCEELSVDDICRHVGFSKYYFCRTFKEVTGNTVVHYINYLRCQNARALLSTGRYNIGESAERSGFRNPSYFARTYKSQMGTLPSEARGKRR